MSFAKKPQKKYRFSKLPWKYINCIHKCGLVCISLRIYAHTHKMVHNSTFNGASTHKHLSSVIMAVIQLVILEKVKWGIPAIKYVTPRTSKGRSAVLNAGINEMLIHIIVRRLHRSETANPWCKKSKQHVLKNVINPRRILI